MKLESETRSLLCISSCIQDYSDIAFQSMVKNLIPVMPGAVDIAGHSPENNRHLVEILRSHCDRLEWCFESDPVLTESQLIMDFRMQAPPNTIRNNLYQWNSMRCCNAVKASLEEERGPYDHVIWARPDLLFLWRADIPSVVGENVVFVSPHDLWGGFNDRFCVGNSRSMAQRMEIFDFFTSSWYPRLLDNPELFLERGAEWNPESVLGFFMKESGIEVMPSFTHFARLKRVNDRIYGIVPMHYGHDTRFVLADRRMSREAISKKKLFDHRLAEFQKLQRASTSIRDPRTQTRAGQRPKRLALLSEIQRFEAEG